MYYLKTDKGIFKSWTLAENLVERLMNSEYQIAISLYNEYDITYMGTDFLKGWESVTEDTPIIYRVNERCKCGVTFDKYGYHFTLILDEIYVGGLAWEIHSAEGTKSGPMIIMKNGKVDYIINITWYNPPRGDKGEIIGNAAPKAKNISSKKVYEWLDLALTDGFPGKPDAPGGGDGEMDGSSDIIPFPTVPEVGNNGLTTLFNPTHNQLSSLSTFLWSPDFIQSLSKFFLDPMDIIISLSIFPFNVPSGVPAQIKCGLIPTGVYANTVDKQFIEFDFGSIFIKEFWGSSLDYSPYSKAHIYLPFLGIQALDVDLIMGKKLGVRYNIDLLTGSACVMISADDNVLYSYQCNVATQIPISSKNYASMITSLTSLATGVLVGGATGGAGAMLGISSAINSAKTSVQKGGRLDSTTGILGIKYPYVFIERPIQSRADKNNRFKGYPSNITKFLKDVRGYTEIDRIFLSNLTCLKEEQDELELLLKNGVYL